MKNGCPRVARWLLITVALPAAVGGQSAIGARVDSVFRAYAAPSGPGCAVGVARDGVPVFTRGYGTASVESRLPITSATTFNIGSVAKQFTAYAVLLLVRDDRLSLHDDVRRWVPEVPAYGATIRVRDLLYHTSGLRDYGALSRLADRPTRTMPEFLALLASQRGVNFTPGTRHEYAHSDYSLLAEVIERASGMPFGQYLEQSIFQPLGMTSTRVHDGRHHPVPGRAFAHDVDGDTGSGSVRIRMPSNELVGGSNVYTSVDDMLRWEANYFTGRVGSVSMMAQLLTRPTLASGDTIPYAYGLNLGEYRGLPTVIRGGSGGGFPTEMIRFPGQRFMTLALCNVSGARPFDLIASVAELYLADEMHPPRPDPLRDSVATPPAEVARFAGIYRPQGQSGADQPFNIMRIVARDGALQEQFKDQLYRLTRLTDGRYFADGLYYEFTANGPTEPVSLHFTGEGITERFVGGAGASLWRPRAAELAAYRGGYTSTDLNVTWQLSVTDGALHLRRNGQRPARMNAIDPDVFDAELGTKDEPLPIGVKFVRNQSGRVNRMLVSSEPRPFERAHAIRFDRLAGNR